MRGVSVEDDGDRHVKATVLLVEKQTAEGPENTAFDSRLRGQHPSPTCVSTTQLVRRRDTTKKKFVRARSQPVWSLFVWLVFSVGVSYTIVETRRNLYNPRRSGRRTEHGPTDSEI